MKSDEIQLLFATALKTYMPVEGQTSDPDLSTLWETLTAIIPPIAYDGEKGIHNLVGLIIDEDAYRACHGANFPTPSRPAIYDVNITTDTSNAVRVCREAAHNAKNKTIDYSPPPSASKSSLSSPLSKICGCANYATPVFSTRLSNREPSCHTSRPCV